MRLAAKQVAERQAGKLLARCLNQLLIAIAKGGAP